MNEAVVFVAILILWFVLARLILPRLGVHT